MSRTIHMCLDIAGFLRNNGNRKSAYRNMFKDETGRFLGPEEAKRMLWDELAAGKRVLPFGDCEGFSYQTGCPGHDDKAKGAVVTEYTA